MDYSKPTLIVISGPNGAGKSTHIQAMLPVEFNGILCFDRDNTRIHFEKALSDSGMNANELFLNATRLMETVLLDRMKIAIRQKEHFVVETPLSHPDYWRYIDLFEDAGYQLQLNYLCLDKVSDCTARVEQRVMEGGHYVAPHTIRGVYEQNLLHINEYSGTFGVIELYDGMSFPRLLARYENGGVTYAVKDAMQKTWILQGLESLSVKLKPFLRSKL